MHKSLDLRHSTVACVANILRVSPHGNRRPVASHALENHFEDSFITIKSFSPIIALESMSLRAVANDTTS